MQFFLIWPVSFPTAWKYANKNRIKQSFMTKNLWKSNMLRFKLNAKKFQEKCATGSLSWFQVVQIDCAHWIKLKKKQTLTLPQGQKHQQRNLHPHISACPARHHGSRVTAKTEDFFCFFEKWSYFARMKQRAIGRKSKAASVKEAVLVNCCRLLPLQQQEREEPFQNPLPTPVGFTDDGDGEAPKEIWKF